MDSAFLNMGRGNRIAALLKLKMDEGKPYRFPRDYSYIEVPFGDAFNISTEEMQEKAVRNQKLLIRPACEIDLNGPYKLLVRTNPELQKFSTCPPMMILDQDGGEQPSFYATFQRDFDFSKLEWCVRLYLMS